MNQYPQGSLLVTFGTVCEPTEEQITILIETARKLPHLGFLFGLKEEYPTQQLVAKAELPNVMLRGFVPQKELLNDSRVLALISHGGANSMLESLYYGKGIIGFPIEGDQHGGVFRMERMNLAISLRDSPSVKFVIDSINMVTDPLGKYQASIKRAQKMMEFRELRSGKDMAYQMRQAIKFNEWSGGNSSSHLVNRAVVDNSFLTTYDYDIKLQVIAMACLFAYFVSRFFE